MTNPNKDPKEIVKRELDETLFASLDFHSELKETVLGKIAVSNKAENTQIERKPWWRYQRIWGTVLVAAITFLLFTTPILLRDSDLNQSLPNSETNLTTLQGDENNARIMEDPLGSQTWDVSTAAEAIQLFGNDLLLPTYSPESFQLENIQVSTAEGKNVNKAMFFFIDQDKSYLVIVERNASQSEPTGFEQVDINGTTAFLKQGDGPDVELQWDLDGIHYIVAGLIPAEEAVKIARSFK